eukprot:scaffold1876_cov257-Pinguiococcus_pyrenoidosus.AAC.6
MKRVGGGSGMLPRDVSSIEKPFQEMDGEISTKLSSAQLSSLRRDEGVHDRSLTGNLHRRG